MFVAIIEYYEEAVFCRNYGSLKSPILRFLAHRLDLRASRQWQLKKGILSLFIDIQNLYDRENVAGFDVDFGTEVQADGSVLVIPLQEPWGGLLPSFGIDWDF